MAAGRHIDDLVLHTMNVRPRRPQPIFWLAIGLVLFATGGSNLRNANEPTTTVDRKAETGEGTELAVDELSFDDPVHDERITAVHRCFCEQAGVTDMPFIKARTNGVRAQWDINGEASHALTTATYQDLPNVQGMAVSLNHEVTSGDGERFEISVLPSDGLIRFGDSLEISLHNSESEVPLLTLSQARRHRFSLPNQEIKDKNESQRGTRIATASPDDIWGLFTAFRSSPETARALTDQQLTELEKLGLEKLEANTFEKCAERQQFSDDGTRPPCLRWEPLSDTDSELLREDLIADISQARSQVDNYLDQLHQELLEALPENCTPS